MHEYINFDKCSGPTIPRLRDSNTRLAQAASGCAPSIEVLPIFDVKQNSVRNSARMGGQTSPIVGFSYNNKRRKESLPSTPPH
ncbi:hypothetical protein K0M31_014206 [Melipona bicolor]|uniref:Uncharacterized protein n=1 Tax=Melipona bicolor TaxID=60889 RepID=A0AA40G8B4_9HYME|nr:hypothetical protein K0M31_014206 [Melipona bicolor]